MSYNPLIDLQLRGKRILKENQIFSVIYYPCN